MMKLLNAIKTLALALMLPTLAITTTGCREDHDGLLNETYEQQLVDLVTYKGLDASSHAIFRLEGRDDLPYTTLTTAISQPEKVNRNQRVLLRYSINSKQGSTWDVKPLEITRITSDSLRVNNNDLDTYSYRPVKLTSAWRSGEFLNLHGQVEYTGQSRQLYLMIDRSTRYSETVQAHLVHDLLGTPNDKIYQWRDFYLSVNVGALMKETVPCKTIKLTVNDVNSKTGTTTCEFKVK